MPAGVWGLPPQHALCKASVVCEWNSHRKNATGRIFSRGEGKSGFSGPILAKRGSKNGPKSSKIGVLGVQNRGPGGSWPEVPGGPKIGSGGQKIPKFRARDPIETAWGLNHLPKLHRKIHFLEGKFSGPGPGNFPPGTGNSGAPPGNPGNPGPREIPGTPQKSRKSRKKGGFFRKKKGENRDFRGFFNILIRILKGF